MSRPASRVVLFRTSRHLSACAALVQDRFPQAELWLVTQPGTEGYPEVAEFPPDRRIVLQRSGPFRLGSWLMSSAWRAARRARFDRAVLLLNNGQGVGYRHLKLAALSVCGPQVLLHRPDDQVLEPWRPWERASQKLLTAVVSGLGWLVLGALVFGPYHAIRLGRWCQSMITHRQEAG